MGKSEYVKLTIGFVSLLVGGLIYVLFRPESLLMFHALRAMGMMGVVERMRESVAGWQLPEFVVFCLPNGLWVVAYTMLMDVLWRNKSEKVRMGWACLMPVAGCLSEVGQMCGLVPGTFDWVDLACYAVPYIIYCLIIRKI